MSKKVIVIGSGFGGLGAAIRLAARGYEVEIFEKRDKLGGRAYVYDIHGFKFDGGPTVITAPFMFDDLFAQAGRNRADYIDFVPVDPFYRIFNHEGRPFDYNNDPEFIHSQIKNWSPQDLEGYQQFIRTTKPIFEKGFLQLADKPFLNLTDMLRIVPDLVRLQSHKSVYQYISQFVKDPFLRMVFSFHPLLVGGNPFDVTSIYAMIHYLEREWGVFYARGGTGAIVDALGKLFVELGGKIHLSSPVEEILIDDRRKVSGIRTLNGELHPASAVVCNADVAWTYRNLIPARFRQVNTNPRFDRMRYSMSLFVIYFGTRRRYLDSRLKHHNIILGPRYQGLLNDIFKRKILAEDFSLYLHMPTLTDPSIAPAGCESFYVLSPVPNLEGDIDWRRAAPQYKAHILEFLETNYLPDLRENIVAEHTIDPLHFQNELNSFRGAAFSIEPVLTQSAWFRPHNRSEDFDNLFFVGAGTHPGAGLPGVLSSSIIAENLVSEMV